MARIRSLKPEFCTSEAINALSERAELHFAKLWTYADDDGRGVDNARLIKAACWPLRDAVTNEDVEGLQAELARHGRIQRYRIGSRSYFQITNWTEHQHPQKKRDSEIPPPPVPENGDTPTGEVSPSGDAYGDTPTVALPPVVVGEGRGVVEGEGEVASAVPVPPLPAPPPDPPPPTAPGRARRLPEDFTVSDEMRRWAAQECPAVPIDAETAKFRDHWRAKAGKDAAKLDWPATWRNWIRRAAEHRPNGNGAPRDRVAETLARARANPL